MWRIAFGDSGSQSGRSECQGCGVFGVFGLGLGSALGVLGCKQASQKFSSPSHWRGGGRAKAAEGYYDRIERCILYPEPIVLLTRKVNTEPAVLFELLFCRYCSKILSQMI